MEIQPPSSISQANALFTGLSQQQISDSIRRIFPFKVKERTDHLVQPATTVTSSSNDYREKEYAEAYRLLHGVVLHPWRSVQDIEQGKTDVRYYDIGYDDISDLQSLNVGRVTGAPELNDPRTAFVGNMLKMKEFQKNIDNEFSYQYMKDLFTTQLDKGSTYYQAQYQKQQEGMNQFMVEKLSNIQPLSMNVAIRNVDYGNLAPSHGNPRDIVVKSQSLYTENKKRARLDTIYEKVASTVEDPPDDLGIIPNSANLNLPDSFSRVNEKLRYTTRGRSEQIIHRGGAQFAPSHSVPGSMHLDGLRNKNDAILNAKNYTLFKSKAGTSYMEGSDSYLNISNIPDSKSFQVPLQSAHSTPGNSRPSSPVTGIGLLFGNQSVTTPTAPLPPMTSRSGLIKQLEKVTKKNTKGDPNKKTKKPADRRSPSKRNKTQTSFYTPSTGTSKTQRLGY